MLRAMLRLGVVGALLIALALLVAPSLPDEGQLVIGGSINTIDSIIFKVVLIDIERQLSGPILVTEKYFEGVPQISPDGSHVAFISSDGRLQVFDINAGEIRDLNPSDREMCCPEWSSDGQRLAFMSAYDYPADRNNATRMLYTVNGDGSDLRELTTMTGLNIPYAWPQWSLDGQQIGFLANEKFHIVDSATGMTRMLDQIRYALCCFEWSPDGNSIAVNYFTNADSPLVVIDLAAETFIQYPEIGYSYRTWSANSRYIAVYDDREYGIFIIDTVNGEIHAFVNFSWYGIPAWSPNEDTIAFIAYQSADPFDDLYMSGPDESNQQHVVGDFIRSNNDQTLLQWSSNGSRLAGFSAFYDQSQVAIALADGTGHQRIMVGNFEDAYFIAWRP